MVSDLCSCSRSQLPNFPSPSPQFLRALPLHFVPPFQPVAHSSPPTPWLLPPLASHPALICVSNTTLGPDPRPGKSRRKTHIHSSGLLGPGPECTKANPVLIFLSLGQCCQSWHVLLQPVKREAGGGSWGSRSRGRTESIRKRRNDCTHVL